MAPESGDPWAPLLDAISAELAVRLTAVGAPSVPPMLLDQLDLTRSAERDVALPLHRAGGIAKIPADDLARRIAADFPVVPGLRGVSCSGAYVNFIADPVWLTQRTLSLIFARGEQYGHADPSGRSISVEHTSANPTGPFHIGRVRNGIIGDTLARVLRAAGAKVTTDYYVDDIGRQVAMVTWIWSKPEHEWPSEIRSALAASPATEHPEKADHRWGRPYPVVSAYLKTHPDAAAAVGDLMRELETGHPPAQHNEIAQSILEGMLASLARLGIRFDRFVWESSLLTDGSVETVVGRLKAAPHAVQEENGAWALDTASYGLPKERARVIFLRKDGTTLYPTRDVAYHLEKFARYARVIDVLGQDHQLHARTLDAMLQEIGESRRPEFVIYQDITAPEGGRMSTRKGSAVWLDELLDEAVDRARAAVLARREDLPEDRVNAIAESVATGAIRYHVVRVGPEKAVTFRWEDALSFEGRSGPFLQYSYARASSIVRKAEAGATAIPAFSADRLGHPEELALIKVLASFPRTVQYVARSNHVHAIASYAHELADQFNRFYHAVPVLKSGDERPSRLALVMASRQALGNALDLLGVDRLDTM
ncbi:MAG: arginine--tRNA ligase [Thermoplasmata archaeon]